MATFPDIEPLNLGDTSGPITISCRGGCYSDLLRIRPVVLGGFFIGADNMAFPQEAMGRPPGGHVLNPGHPGMSRDPLKSCPNTSPFGVWNSLPRSLSHPSPSPMGQL